MPAMPRPKSDATKIADAVLGRPHKSRSSKSKKVEDLDRQLMQQQIKQNK